MARIRTKRIANMTRAEFFMALEDACKRWASVSRSIQEGKAELLGLFTLPAFTWIVKVPCISKDTWIRVTQGRHDMSVAWLQDPASWACWVGDEVVGTPINLGDKPEQYAAFRNQACQLRK